MKFYVGETPFLVAEKKLSPELEQSAYILGSASANEIWKHYEMKRDGQMQGNRLLIFYTHDYPKTIAVLKEKFKLIEAAGGLVYKDEKLLFIKRLGKWDLPKGKMEKGEFPSETAVREVEEECMITASLGSFVGHTWHTYFHKGKDVLKCTHWFMMECTDDSQMKPQTEEEIEEVCWFSAPEIQEKVFANTYPNIRDIYGISLSE